MTCKSKSLVELLLVQYYFKENTDNTYLLMKKQEFLSVV